jgi:predicted nuclease of predicted toxin-antitoxin system
MKLLLDENLSPPLVSMLPDSFAGSLYVLQAQMGKRQIPTSGRSLA